MHSGCLKNDWFYETVTNCMEQSPHKVDCSSAQEILQLLDSRQDNKAWDT
jgi:hypothetical protein